MPSVNSGGNAAFQVGSPLARTIWGMVQRNRRPSGRDPNYLRDLGLITPITDISQRCETPIARLTTFDQKAERFRGIFKFPRIADADIPSPKGGPLERADTRKAPNLTALTSFDLSMVEINAPDELINDRLRADLVNMDQAMDALDQMMGWMDKFWCEYLMLVWAGERGAARMNCFVELDTGDVQRYQSLRDANEFKPPEMAIAAWSTPDWSDNASAAPAWNIMQRPEVGAEYYAAGGFGVGASGTSVSHRLNLSFLRRLSSSVSGLTQETWNWDFERPMFRTPQGMKGGADYMLIVPEEALFDLSNELGDNSWSDYMLAAAGSLGKVFETHDVGKIGNVLVVPHRGSFPKRWGGTAGTTRVAMCPFFGQKAIVYGQRQDKRDIRFRGRLVEQYKDVKGGMDWQIRMESQAKGKQAILVADTIAGATIPRYDYKDGLSIPGGVRDSAGDLRKFTPGVMRVDMSYSGTRGPNDL